MARSDRAAAGPAPAAEGRAKALDGAGAAGAGLADKVGRRSTGRAEAPSAGAAALAGLWGGRELDEDIGRIVAAGRRLLIWHCEDYPCLCCHARNSCAGIGRLMW